LRKRQKGKKEQERGSREYEEKCGSAGGKEGENKSPVEGLKNRELIASGEGDHTISQGLFYSRKGGYKASPRNFFAAIRPPSQEGGMTRGLKKSNAPHERKGMKRIPAASTARDSFSCEGPG